MHKMIPFTLQQNIATDNAFSTIQVIHQLLSKVNDVIEFVNNIETDAHSYTDQKVGELRAQLEEQVTRLDGLIEANTTDIEALNREVSQISETLTALIETVSQLDQRVTDVRTELLERIASVRAELLTAIADALRLANNYTDGAVNVLRDELLELIKRHTLKVYDIYDGQKREFEQVMYHQIALLVDVATPTLSINMLNRMFVAGMNVDGTNYKTIANLTYGNLMEVLGGITNNFTVTIQKTSGGTSEVFGSVINTLAGIRKNNYACVYGLFYRMMRLYDVGNRVVPYTFYNMMKTYTGFDNWNCNTFMGTNNQ